MDFFKKMSLGKKILIGIAIGLAIGFISPRAAEIISPLGTVFLRLLKMLIVPLVFFSITSGVCKMGDVKQLRTVGLRFVLYILITSGLSASVGVIAGLIVKPGTGTTEFLNTEAQVESVSYNFIDNVVSWVPDNVVNAMATANMLQIIVFAIFLGVALLSLGDKVKGFVSGIDQGSEAMLKITAYVMEVSPIGIASLMATMVNTVSGATMKEVITFLITDNVCALLILFVLYPFIIKVLAGLNPFKFMKKITEPMLVAVTTTSSAATLPVSIKVAEEKLGVPENIYGFTLPLGNTCGMNGFALFVGLCCIFASNLYGFDVTFSRIIQFVFLGIILSVGAAGVKGAGIVMSTVLLESLGMPLSLIPILAAIWPTIDPAHTVLNNVSDLAGTTLVANSLGKLDKEVFENS
ncbi:dicarboxylate/amino acid:cation symporter [Anaerotignum propionicum]|uniref:dicarboxylate/amino acid:cation symporter n=1 Tax=Anaerotignum propionicum TaxID=28446 RepID=UPI002108C833|nr:dicarboxylate/amino acid:cation symporter [Anaerotignum propionicum]MCQ4936473.1 dicarboxylate/amino acid:cation symporter [Anaerotignum propionicum]